MAAGETFVIISGEFDISVGSIFGLTGVAVALLMEFNVNPWLAVLITLLVGACCGFLNGTLTAFARIPSFIVTLGTLNVFRSIAFIITDGRSANPLQGDLPNSVIEQFYFLGQGKLFGVVPMQFIIMIVFLLGLGFILHNTIFGFRVFAVGGSPQAAAISGISYKWIKVLAFVFCGFTAAVGGIINCSFLGLAESYYGTGTELDVLAAVIIGGASLTGGEGSLLGTLVGALLLGVIRNGLVLLSVPSWWQTFFIGAVIIFAVGVDRLMSSRRAG